jgi:hypothetical protein
MLVTYSEVRYLYPINGGAAKQRRFSQWALVAQEMVQGPDIH